jgi:hypothetical protein
VSTTTSTQATAAPARVVYSLQGTLLEACSCGVLCPCWIGQDPDTGACDAINAYHFDKGEIDGVDVSGLNIVKVVHIPGNVLTPGSWKVVMLVDTATSQRQRDAIVAAYTGKLGGPLADLAGLVGELKAIETADISHSVVEGEGRLRIEGRVEADMAPFRSADGTITTLRDSLFSTVPGSPAWVGQASHHRVSMPEHGFEWAFEGRNAIQAEYNIEFLA